MDPLLSSSYSIIPAEEADILSLASILTLSHSTEATMPFFFPDWPRIDTILPYMTARLAGKFAEPHSTFYKAVDDTSGEILGLVCVTLETGEEVVDRKMTNPGAYHLYLKWVYEDVEKYDVDLNAQGEPYRGFGIYRT
ncbi:uncharacterized protein PAC_19078 [Phialocephala subalpina]|uniref:N-acetyltransferase domain-containing protein n=1 Tax=Phialocephala subalpina TaxID=576137 RepID=A0A1L7XVZ9_9HELO|nr:uncharacterized protein PAC_19078 [Phialocephala subalpina]